jgi:RND family efflux transporter MFP subunit
VKRLLLCAALAACANGETGSTASSGSASPGSGSATPAAPPKDGGALDAQAASAKGYVGVVTPAETMEIAPLVPGRIATINVREGDDVKAGDVIAEMDPTSMKEELRAAEADLNAAQAAYRQAAVDVEDARRKYVLEKKAVADGVSPRQNLEEAAVEVKRASANADKLAATAAAAKSRVETARDHVGNTKLSATFDGIVQHRSKNPGDTVQAGQPIVSILGRADLRLRFAVPPEQAKTLQADTKVVATVDNRPVPAVVRRVSPTVDADAGMIIVEATFTDPAIVAELRPGAPAWVAVP